MNLKKYTKAELISKIKGLKDNSNNPNSNLITILLSLKSLLLKITLIAVIIKVFKKFSIFNRIWRFFNTILFSIFGISLIDFYEIEILSNIIHKIMDIFSNFYLSTFGLLKKVDVPIKETPSSSGRLNPSQSNTKGIDENNRIIERYTKIIHNEIIPEENESFYKNKYIILAALLLLSGVTWYFWDDIRPAGTSILTWLNVLKSRSNNNPDGNTPGTPKPNIPESVVGPVDLTPGTHKSALQTLKDKLFSRFYKDKSTSGTPSPDIELVKGSPSLKDLQNMKLDLHPTGEFINKSDQNFKSITKFIDDFESKSLEGTPDANLFLYNFLRTELFVISSTYSLYYNDWIKNDSINDTINKFVDLENEVVNNTEYNIQENKNVGDNQSDTYNEVANATIEEQDVWSDKAMSPIVLSPLNIHDNSVTEDQARMLFKAASHKSNKEETHSSTGNPVDTDSSDSINQMDQFFTDKPIESKAEFIQGSSKDINIPKENPMNDTLKNANISEESKTSWKDAFKNIKSKFNKEESIPEVRVSPPKTTVVEIPDNEDLSDLFPHIKTTENSDLMKEIRASQKDENNDALKHANISDDDRSSWLDSLKNIRSKKLEYGTPKVANIGLQTPIEEQMKTSPLLHKPSISNLLDDTMNLFDDDPADIDHSSKSEENLSNEKDETQESDIKLSRINWREEIKYNIQRGDPQDRFIEFDFGKHFDKITKVFIILNDGSSQYFNPHQNKATVQMIKWDNFASLNPNSKVLDLFKIFIIDSNAKSCELYSNPDVKILDCYKTNSTRFSKK
jgi:hypothetical protein